MGQKYFKTAAMVFCDDGAKTSAQLRDGDWSTFSLVTSSTITGKNYAAYRDALARRLGPTAAATAITETASSSGAYPVMTITGTDACAHWCSLFDRVYLGHAPSKEFVNMVKARSQRPNGTEVFLYFFNITTIPQALNRNSWFDTFDAKHGQPTTKLLTGSGAGGTTDGRPAGCTAVDPAEQTDQAGNNYAAATCRAQDALSGSVHEWMVNMVDTTILAEIAAGTAWAKTLRDALLVRYPGGEIDGILIDNCNTNRTTGTATNYSSGNDAGFNTGVSFVLGDVQKWIGKRGQRLKVTTNGSGHGCGDRVDSAAAVGVYNADNCASRYQEFFFHEGNAPGFALKTFDQIKADLNFQQRYGYEQIVTPLWGGTSPSTSPYHSGTRVPTELWAANHPRMNKLDGTTQQAAVVTDYTSYERGPAVVPSRPFQVFLDGTTNTFTIQTGHGLQNGTRVKLTGTVPAELANLADIFIVNIGSSSGQFAAGVGGSAVDFTGNGGNNVLYGVDSGDWDRLWSEVKARGLEDKFFVVTCRHSSRFGTFWDPTFGPVY